MLNEVLNYDELVRAYLEGINSSARNLTVGPEFLDMWVPEEDHNQSLFGLFEAAESAKHPLIRVGVGAETAQKLDREALRRSLARYGALDFQEEGGRLLVTLHYGAAGASFKIHPYYQRKVQEASKAVRFERALRPAGAGESAFTNQVDGASLSCLVDEKGIVADAAHSGAQGLSRVLLDQLCSVMVGRSLQEARDHGKLRVEFLLRDAQLPPPVTGILTAENGDPAFACLQKFVGPLFQAYVEARHVEVKRNFWDDAASARWAALSTEQKIAEARSAMLATCKELGLQTIGWEVVGIKDQVRIVLSLQQDPAKPSFGAGMIKLERALRAKLDPRLELQLESSTDRNKRIERTGRTASAAADAAL